MRFRVFLLAASLCAFVPATWAQEDFSASNPAENPVESTGATFEFSARASTERLKLDETFTLEISVVQKWWDVLSPVELDIPGVEAFRQVGEQEQRKDFTDFRGVSTHQATYLLRLAPTATGSFTLGPVTARDGSGSRMEADLMRVEVVPADAPTPRTPAVPSVDAVPPTRFGVSLPSALTVLGTLALLLVALYVVLSFVPTHKPTLPRPWPEPEVPALPSDTSDQQAFFAALSHRYGRDVRSLTTREIAALESDPEDRVRVTALLDRVRSVRYAERS